MADKRWAMGTKIQRKNPISLAYEDIPGLGDITGPDQTTDWLDLTSHDSPNSSEEGVPTVHRHGEIRAPMRYDPVNLIHKALLADMQAKRLGDWYIVMTDPANTKLSFQGYVTGLSFAFPVAGALTQNLVIRMTGALTVI